MYFSVLKRILAFYILSLFLAGGNVHAVPVKIVALGDSITQGDEQNNSYRRPLWQMLNNQGYSVDFVGSQNINYLGPPPNQDFDMDNEGHWGWRADELLVSLPGWLTGYTPDIALIHVGTNDAFQGQSVASTAAELENIIDTFRADNPNVVILLAQVIPAAETTRSIAVEQLNAEIPNIVIRKNLPQSPVYLVDQHTGFLISELRDGVHPNLAGQQKIAAKWFETLTTVLAGMDVTPPTISSVSSSGDPGKITLIFSEAVTVLSAKTAANYVLDNGITITAANLGVNNKTVTLDVSGLAEHVVYTLTVNNIQDRATAPNSIEANSTAGLMLAVNLAGRVNTDLQLLYLFNEATGSTVYDVSGVSNPMNLSIDLPANTQWLAEGGLALNGSAFIGAVSGDTKIMNSVGSSNEITVEAWIQPANTTQGGPARIVTFSGDAASRNFTLGQLDNRYDVRLRTSLTNSNGSSITTRTNTGVVDTTLSHLVFTRKTTGETVIYENGGVVASSTIAGDFSNWSSSYVFGLGNEVGVDERSWLGEYHMVAVYERALLQSEVQQNYSAGLFTSASSPPNLTIATPSQSVTFASTSLSITGTATDDGTIGLLRYQVNAVAWIPFNFTSGNNWSFDLDLSTLNAGSNTITVEVFDDELLSTTASITITRQTELDTDGDGIVNSIDTDDDNDGFSDVFELTYGMDPLVDTGSRPTDDADSDGVFLIDEIINSSSDNSADTDSDGLTDYYEINTSSTDPNSSTAIQTGPVGDMNSSGEVGLGDLIILQQIILNPSN